MNIFIDNRQNDIDVNNEVIDAIEAGVREVLDYENIPLDSEVSISFVTNSEIHQLNKEYRKVNRETDVLSFPVDMDFDIEGLPNVLGDVIISVEKAKEQAQEYGHSFKREMVYLTVHSIFHLLGYDHMIEEDRDIMRRKEEIIMSRLNISRN